VVDVEREPVAIDRDLRHARVRAEVLAAGRRRQGTNHSARCIESSRSTVPDVRTSSTIPGSGMNAVAPTSRTGRNMRASRPRN
jgi:hypothetical protein